MVFLVGSKFEPFVITDKSSSATVVLPVLRFDKVNSNKMFSFEWMNVLICFTQKSVRIARSQSLPCHIVCLYRCLLAHKLHTDSTTRLTKISEENEFSLSFSHGNRRSTTISYQSISKWSLKKCSLSSSLFRLCCSHKPTNRRCCLE